jgi:hypothetical protein
MHADPQACMCHPIVDALVLSLCANPLSPPIVHPLSPALNSNKQCHPFLLLMTGSTSATSSSKKHEEALAKYDKVLAIQQ